MRIVDVVYGMPYMMMVIIFMAIFGRNILNLFFALAIVSWLTVARALALNPKLILADEPVSALDVSIQSQILNLLNDLQEEFNLTYLFIAHDLAVIEHISTRIAVMYLGIIAEIAGSADLYKDPLHPYTRALLSAVPIPDPEIERKRKRIILEGDVPSPDKERFGCYFYERCPSAMQEKCKENIPRLKEVKPGHLAACFLYFDP
ncbi:Oligopeptide transport ATP-binding protein OppF [subsurface metagenome]